MVNSDRVKEKRKGTNLSGIDYEQVKKVLDYRFYTATLPSPNEMVMVRVTEVVEGGFIFCSLCSYGGLKAMLTETKTEVNELRNMPEVELHQKVSVRVGFLFCARVSAVSVKSGTVDVTLSGIQRSEIIATRATYNKEKQILLAVAITIVNYPHIQLEDVFKTYIWPVHQENNTYLDYEGELIAPPEDSIVTEAIHQNIKAYLHRRISQYKLTCSFDMYCAGPDGVNALKNSITRTYSTLPSIHADKGVGIVLKLIAPPTYSVTSVGNSEDIAIGKLNTFAHLLTSEIQGYEGGFCNLMQKLEELNNTQSPH